LDRLTLEMEIFKKTMQWSKSTSMLWWGFHLTTI
jgi:hypothetical protein